MTEVTGSTAGGEAIFSTELPADAPETFNSVREAAEYYTSIKEKKPAESAKEATAEPELAQANDDPAEPAPIEEPEEADPAEVPLIDPPRSWTKAEKERFQSLPRETQEYLHTREQERDRDVRRSQNEVAEERKAAKAEREAAEQLKKQYEAQLPALMQSLQDAHSQEFSEIKSMADVEKIANAIKQAQLSGDPFTAGELNSYLSRWQVHQQKMASVKAELDQAEGKKAQQYHSEWTQHVQKENELAAEYIPELADKVKGQALTQRVATELLPELGFKDSELADLASGKSKLSIYDHRVQRLLADAVKLRDIQKAPKAIATKEVPPVQRPGTSRPSGQGADSERLQVLNRKPELTVKEATELYTLQHRSRRAS